MAKTTFTIKVLDAKKLIEKYKAIGKVDLMPAILRGTRRVQARAKELVPVGTPESTGIKGYVGGTLKGSIKTKTFKSQESGLVFTNIEYGPYIEFGTRYMSAQPFLRPALEQSQQDIYDDIAKLIRQQTRK